MEQIKSNNKTIAKNTMFLYFRMMFTMVIALYTSRVILQTLGVEDYGIYQSVGGIVGFLAFINNALSTGSSRFLTFELGTGNLEKLRRTFSTTLSLHIAIAIILVIIAETVGLYFLYNQMVIPKDRMDAAVFTFHISIITAVFSITQVPYNASIISHEKMAIFAYISFVEVSCKLGIVYLLTIGGFDRLKLYATLLLIVQVGLMCFYRIYCVSQFKETKYKFILDKQILKSIAGFSGWSLFAGISIALNSQGILLLLNMFFSPAVVTARAISIQVNMAANQFVQNFRTAVNPQIIKKFAAEDYVGSKRLLLSSTKFSYFLMFFLCLPIYLLAEPILRLWLGIVPEYTVIFLQLIILQSLFQVFDTSLYTALYAKGRLKENAIISPLLGLLRFPLIYILFKHGYSPVVLSWASLVTYMIIGLIIKPLLVIKIVNYTWSDIGSLFKPCLKVTMASIPIPLLCYLFQDVLFSNKLLSFICILSCCLVCSGISIWYLGLDYHLRTQIVININKRLNG